MKIVDIADEIFRDLAEPEIVKIPTIAFWLERHIGDLNTLCDTDFKVHHGELVDCDNYKWLYEQFPPGWVWFHRDHFGDMEKGIFKMLYTIHYYELQIRANLGASAYDWSELGEGDSHIRRVSKNEIAKTLRSVKNDLSGDLKEVLIRYRLNKVRPLGLEGVNNLLQFMRVRSGIANTVLSPYANEPNS